MLLLTLVFSLLVSTSAPWSKQPQSNKDWVHNMDTGKVWGTSSNLARHNPYYNTFRQISKQMDTYAPAQHVGKINRGSYLNPELNTPAQRGFGFQSDFNPEDLESGAFKYKPQGQRFRAAEVHVNEGLASYVGEEVMMPLGQHVQEDGTILITTSGRRSPCHPSPCRRVRMPTCTVVNSVTAKCSRAQDYRLTLTYESPTTSRNSMWLVLVPAFHNGSQPMECSRTGHADSIGEDAWIYAGEDPGCGVIPDQDYYDYAYDDEDPTIGDKTHILTRLADGSKYQDYTYQVIAEHYYTEWGRPQLTVEYGGEVQQVLSIPQNDADTDVDPDGLSSFYFFGCFRPQLGLVDTRGAGFYHDSDYEVDYTNGLRIYFDYNLCKSLLHWPGTLGFNY